MTDDKVKVDILMAQKANIEKSAEELEDEISAIEHSIWEIVGNCPLCRNSHYPFCGGLTIED